MAEMDRITFLESLIDYADDSKTFNPHFYLEEMLARLRIDEGTFNILRYSLGEQYCRFVDVRDGRSRFSINVANCRNLKDEIDRERRMERRHQESIRIAVLAATLAAAAGVALTLWFTAN